MRPYVPITTDRGHKFTETIRAIHMLKNHARNRKLDNKESPGIGRLHKLLPYSTRKTVVQQENTKNPINKSSRLKVTGRGWRRGNRGRRSAWNCSRRRT